MTFLRSKTPIKWPEIRNWVIGKRLVQDWQYLIKIGKSNILSLNGIYFLINFQPESILYKFRGCLNPKRGFLAAWRTLTKLKKTVWYKLLSAKDLHRFKQNKGCQSIPRSPLNHSRYSQASKTSRIMKSKSRLAYSKLKINFIYSCIFNKIWSYINVCLRISKLSGLFNWSLDAGIVTCHG